MLIASIASMHENFNKGNIQVLLEMGHKVHLAANFDQSINFSTSRLEEFKLFCDVHSVSLHHVSLDRLVLSPIKLLRAIRELNSIIKKEDISFVHSHTPIGGMIGRISSRINRIPNIYTAHGFHFFKGSSWLSWLLYFPIEYILSFLTTGIITINQEDYNLASKLMKCQVYYVPGIGISTDESQILPKKQVSDLTLISIGELNVNKNHASVIDVVSKLEISYRYLVIGSGKNYDKLHQLIEHKQLQSKVQLLGYQNNIFNYLNQSDIYIHPSKREGLPVSVMEAMLVGLPIIASNIRGNKDLVDHGKGGFLYPVNKTDKLIEYINLLNEFPDMRISFGEYNKKKIEEYKRNIVNSKMKQIYSKIINVK